jgi:hypothetical protein
MMGSSATSRGPSAASSDRTQVSFTVDAQPGLMMMDDEGPQATYLELATPGMRSVTAGTRVEANSRDAFLDQSTHQSSRVLASNLSQHAIGASAHSAMSSSTSSASKGPNAIPTFGPLGWRAKLPTDDAVTRIPTNLYSVASKTPPRGSSELAQPIAPPPEMPLIQGESPELREMSRGVMMSTVYAGFMGPPIGSSQPPRPMPLSGGPMGAEAPALREMNQRVALPQITYDSRADSDQSPILTFSNPPQPQPEMTKLALPSSIRPISNPDAPPLRDMNHSIVMPAILYDDDANESEFGTDESEDEMMTESGLSMRYNTDEITASSKNKSSKIQYVQNATSVSNVLNSASVSRAMAVSIETDESLRRLAAMTEWKERRVKKRAAETISRAFRGSWHYKRFRMFRHAVMKIQSSFRQKAERSYFLRLRTVVLLVQRHIRAIQLIRRIRNAETLSRVAHIAWRRYRARRRLNWLISTVEVTNRNKKRQNDRAATKIQRCFRFHKALCALFRLVAVRRIQRQVREWIKKRRLHELNAGKLIYKNYRKYVERRLFLLQREIPILEASRRAQAAFDKAVVIKSEMEAQFLTYRFFSVIFFGLVLMACNSLYVSSRIGTDSQLQTRLRVVDSAYFSKLRGGVHWWVSPQALESFYPMSFPRNVYEYIYSEPDDSVLWNKNFGACAMKGRDPNGRIASDGVECLRELRNEWLPSLSSLIPDPRSEIAMALCLNHPSLPAPSSSIIRRLFLIDKDYGILPSWRVFRNLNAYQVSSVFGFLISALGLGASVYSRRKLPRKEPVSIGYLKQLFTKSIFELDPVTRVGIGCAALSFAVTSLLGISSIRLVYFWLSDSLSEASCDNRLPLPPLFTILTRLYEPRTEHRFPIDKAVFPLELDELFISLTLAGVFGFILIEWRRHRKNCLLLRDKLFAQIDKLTMDCYGIKIGNSCDAKSVSKKLK